jgi:hypothetical protein
MIEQRIPELSIEQLTNLHANAIRLAQSGTPAQQAEAERLLPIVGEEIENRRKARAASAAEQRARKTEAAAIARKAAKARKATEAAS